MPGMRQNALMTLRDVRVLCAGLALSVSSCAQPELSLRDPAPPRVTDQALASSGALPSAATTRQTIDRYCLTCHDERLEMAGLRLDLADLANVTVSAEVWEKVVRKLRTGTMPPANVPQPSAEARSAMVSWLETSLDGLESPSGQHRDLTAPQSYGVSELHPGPLAPGHRRHFAPARR